MLSGGYQRLDVGGDIEDRLIKYAERELGPHRLARIVPRNDLYLPLLAREMEMAAEHLAADRREVVRIHWGGGTPTFLPPEDLTELMSLIRRSFRLAPDCEIGVEVDPRECSPEHLDALAAAGVNRLSMGLQELDPQVQEAVNRIQSADQTWAVLGGARSRDMTMLTDIASISINFMYVLNSSLSHTFSIFPWSPK